MGGTVAAGQTAAALQAANTAALQAANTEAYVNVGGDAFLSISTHQSQQQWTATPNRTHACTHVYNIYRQLLQFLNVF